MPRSVFLSVVWTHFCRNVFSYVRNVFSYVLFLNTFLNTFLYNLASKPCTHWVLEKERTRCRPRKVEILGKWNSTDDVTQIPLYLWSPSFFKVKMQDWCVWPLVISLSLSPPLSPSLSLSPSVPLSVCLSVCLFLSDSLSLSLLHSRLSVDYRP